MTPVQHQVDEKLLHLFADALQIQQKSARNITTTILDNFRSITTHQHAILAESQQPRIIRVRHDSKHELTDWLVVSAIATEVGVRIDDSGGLAPALVNVNCHRECCILQSNATYCRRSHRTVNNTGGWCKTFAARSRFTEATLRLRLRLAFWLRYSVYSQTQLDA